MLNEKNINVKDPSLTNEELIHLYRQGNQEAKLELFERNQGLVHFVINYYHYDKYNISLSYDDLEQEGRIGLLKAIDMYDEEVAAERGSGFSTYAPIWIRQMILRAIYNNGWMIRIPVHLKERYVCAKKQISEEQNQLGKELPPERIKEILKEKNITQQEFDQVTILEDTPSLNAKVMVGDSEGDELGSLIPDTKNDMERTIEKVMLLEDLEKLFKAAKLTDREKYVLCSRYGVLYDDNPKTLREVSNEIGVTRERARQLEQVAVKKIRQCPIARFYTEKPVIPLSYKERYYHVS